MKHWLMTFLIIAGCAEEPKSVARDDEQPACDQPTEFALQAEAEKPSDEVTTYEKHVDPLFKKYCVSCHAGDDRDPAAPAISGFKDLSADEFLLGRLAVSSVQRFTMPKAITDNEDDDPFGADVLMQPDERQVFVKWAQDGFRKNKDSKPLEDVNWNISQKPTYDVNIAPILAQMCQTCHADGQQPPELSDFEKMKKDDYKLALDIVVEVMEGDMPKLSPLPSSQKLMFQLWALQGFRQTNADPIEYRTQSLNEYLDVPPEDDDAIEATPDKDPEPASDCQPD